MPYLASTQNFLKILVFLWYALNGLSPLNAKINPTERAENPVFHSGKVCGILIERYIFTLIGSYTTEPKPRKRNKTDRRRRGTPYKG